MKKTDEGLINILHDKCNAIFDYTMEELKEYEENAKKSAIITFLINNLLSYACENSSQHKIDELIEGIKFALKIKLHLGSIDGLSNRKGRNWNVTTELSNKPEGISEETWSRFLKLKDAPSKSRFTAEQYKYFLTYFVENFPAILKGDGCPKDALDSVQVEWAHDIIEDPTIPKDKDDVKKALRQLIDKKLLEFAEGK